MGFGFKILKQRAINYDTNDKSVAAFIASQEPSFIYCMECGCCAATCTAGNFTHFSLREINILLKRGENSAVREKIDRCMLCGKCTLVCPRGVNTRNILLLAKESLNNK